MLLPESIFQVKHREGKIDILIFRYIGYFIKLFVRSLFFDSTINHPIRSVKIEKYFYISVHENILAALQNPLHLGDNDTIIGKGCSLAQSRLHSPDHLFFVEHTSSAMDYQSVRA